MSETMEGSGQCLCGAVQFSAKKISKSLGACHCSMCRRWSAGPFLAVDCGTEIVFKGEEHISVFVSSKWAERGFCKQCGTHLFYRLKTSKQTIVSAGLFNDDSEFVFDHQVFVDDKPSFYRFANETHDMTGAEVFAKYAPASE